MTNTKFQHKAPFHTTHRRRKDGMEAMLLAIRDGVALYRVKFMHGGRIQDSTTSRDAALFAADFEVAACMRCPVDFETTPDCACPYEHWHVGIAGCCLDIHVEEEGYTHIILNTGDDEFEHTLPGVVSLEEARPTAMAWAADMLCEVPA